MKGAILHAIDVYDALSMKPFLDKAWHEILTPLPAPYGALHRCWMTVEDAYHKSIFGEHSLMTRVERIYYGSLMNAW